jgi:hypothetical protein
METSTPESANINNVENPQPNQNNRPSTRGGFAPRGKEGGEDSRNSQIIIQEIRTSTASITEEDIAPKGAQKPRRIPPEFSKRRQ